MALQRRVAVLSCVALGALCLPWFTDWVPFSLDDPMFLLVQKWPLETWVGWVVAGFDVTLLVSAWAPGRAGLRRGLAAAAILALAAGGVWWVTLPRSDLELRMQALGPPSFDWWWLRWGFAVAVVANVALLLLGRGQRADSGSRSSRDSASPVA